MAHISVVRTEDEMAHQVHDRVQDQDGRKGDVLKISKDGKRIYVSFWLESLAGKVTLCKQWAYASSWTKV